MLVVQPVRDDACGRQGPHRAIGDDHSGFDDLSREPRSVRPVVETVTSTVMPRKASAAPT